MNEPTQPPFDQFKYFAGFDWARDKHHIVIVDGGGQVVLSLCFDDDAQGWAKLREKIQNLPAPKLALAVETNCGPAVERLLEMGLAVYPLNLPISAVTAFCTTDRGPDIGEKLLTGVEVLAPAPPEYPEGFVVALSNALAKEVLWLRMTRIFVPNCQL